ncbi:MAG: phosphoribosylglycinamide formyltransferase [Hyphomicrobium sp.]
MTTRKVRTSILISGRGSNMMSLVEASRQPGYPAEIVAVVSNRPDAEGLKWAAKQGIPAIGLDHKQFATRNAFEAKLHTTLMEHGTELICCAGFMRMLTGGFIDRWRDRQLNIHPSLLPSFAGLDTHERAIDQGVRIAGCTVHFMRLEMDSGPIVGQAAVPVLSGDTGEDLAARVLAAEHKLYPWALALVASGRATVENEKIVIREDVNFAPVLFSPILPPGSK